MCWNRPEEAQVVESHVIVIYSWKGITAKSLHKTDTRIVIQNLCVPIFSQIMHSLIYIHIIQYCC